MAIALAVAVSPSALAGTAKDKAHNECATTAYTDYIAANLERFKQQGLDLSIGAVIANRRAMEGYCVRFVQCLKTKKPGLRFAANLAAQRARLDSTNSEALAYRP
jgi:hypothetical protein